MTRRLSIPLLLAALVLSGCAGAKDVPASDGPARPLDPESFSIDVHYAGQDPLRVCPVPPACLMPPPPPAVFEATVENDTRVQGIRIFLGWDDRRFDDVGTFRFTAHCTPNGDAGCAEELLLAEAEGPFPLTLEAHGLGLPGGARIVLTVEARDAGPGAGGTGQPYGIDGVLVVLRDRGFV